LWDKSTAVVAVGLALLTFLAYGKAGKGEFINLDDDAYVQFQPMVNQGLRSAGVVWAFTATHSNNWHPLTSLSHMLDCGWFGVRPGPMHVENVCWHAANAILVLVVWIRLTGARWRSAIVAAFFALHPLHVESVAWISERKDVLSACFFLLAIYAYTFHAKQAGLRTGGRRFTRAYWFALGSFTLALLSKPMVVTLPMLLLLLDFWPLRRLDPQGSSPRGLIIEKLPFFGLALMVSAITFFVQSNTGAANYAARFSMSARLGNAAVSCVRYLGKAFWPGSLSVFYRHPGYWPEWAVAGSCALLLLVSLVAWRQRNARPWLAFGWLWFLIGLVPVLGLIQVGAQAMADRYTYIPLLGILTAVACAVPLREGRDPKTGVLAPSATSREAGQPGKDHGRVGLAARASWVAVGISLAACLLLTWHQVGYWHDSISLYRHSILAGEDNATVRYLLGAALQSDGAPESEVAGEYRRALELDPSYVNAMTQLAVMALNHQNYDECQQWIEQSLKLEPKNPALHKNMGAFYVRSGRPEEAIKQFEEGLKLDPAYADAHHELAWIAVQQGQLETAARELEAVAKAAPWDAQARLELGDTLAKLGRKQDARRELERAVWIMPNLAQARARLETLF
jgi:tetratricopeptide (TPR) repeat protein